MITVRDLLITYKYCDCSDVTHLSRRSEVYFSSHSYKALASQVKKQIILKVIDGNPGK